MNNNTSISTVLLTTLAIILSHVAAPASAAETPVKQQERPPMPKAFEPEEDFNNTMDAEFDEMLSTYRKDLVAKDKLLEDTQYFLRSVIYEHNYGRLTAQYQKP